jgi:hypothetical protein
MSPEQIVALKAPDAVMARMRGKVEKLLRQGYAKGASTAVDEVETAREQPIKRTAPEPAD